MNQDILSCYMPEYFSPPPMLKFPCTSCLALKLFTSLLEDSCSSIVLDMFITALHCQVSKVNQSETALLKIFKVINIICQYPLGIPAKNAYHIIYLPLQHNNCLSFFYRPFIHVYPASIEMYSLIQFLLGLLTEQLQRTIARSLLYNTLVSWVIQQIEGITSFFIFQAQPKPHPMLGLIIIRAAGMHPTPYLHPPGIEVLTCSSLILALFMICSRLVRNLFKSCSWRVQSSEIKD